MGSGLFTFFPSVIFYIYIFYIHIFFFKGPALYAYNNAAFTEEDWESIQKAGRSDKRNDPNKVGRFGIGFNSVYHTTGENQHICVTVLVLGFDSLICY